MVRFSIQALEYFDAVVECGGFQQAADKVNRSHAAVFAAITKLESGLGLKLLDRGGYRVTLTDAGRSFHTRVRAFLEEVNALQIHADQLSMGDETHLVVVIGDTCPSPPALELLSLFFARCHGTRLDLHFETIAGPLERLFDDYADLILHSIDRSDPRVEWIDFGVVSFIPVVAPGFLPFEPSKSITPEHMRTLTQCVIRDTGTHSDKRNYYVIEGAPQCTVADHSMKRDLILRGMAWGHLPHFLIGEDLNEGRLISIAGHYFPGMKIDLVAARRRGRPHGPVANRLWQHLRDNAGCLLEDASAKSRPSM
jgi:DNA-binding transcriptional LysR family regulator